MCGEKYSCTGKTPFGCRITPACAGKSGLAALDHALAGDHPRVCGEKEKVKAILIKSGGSPPRMRGKVRIPCWRSVSAGITPAYAGKSQQLDKRRNRKQDHPRVCGEKQFKFSTSFTVRGSPPHVRGKVGVVKLLSELPRITPACAGKRAKIKGATESSGDHPRMCGEKCTPLKP